MPNPLGAFYVYPDVQGLLGRDVGAASRRPRRSSSPTSSSSRPRSPSCRARRSARAATCACPTPSATSQLLEGVQPPAGPLRLVAVLRGLSIPRAVVRRTLRTTAQRSRHGIHQSTSPNSPPRPPTCIRTTGLGSMSVAGFEHPRAHTESAGASTATRRRRRCPRGVSGDLPGIPQVDGSSMVGAAIDAAVIVAAVIVGAAIVAAALKPALVALLIAESPAGHEDTPERDARRRRVSGERIGLVRSRRSRAGGARPGQSSTPTSTGSGCSRDRTRPARGPG